MHDDIHDGRTDDDALLAELAGVLRPYTEPPAGMVDATKELFTWRSVDAELAALAFDSVLDDAPVGTRSAPGPRTLTFEAGELIIEVEIDPSPGGRRMLGQLVPARSAELELRWDGDPVTGRADGFGRFVLPLPAGRVRVSLRCVLDDGTAVETAWVVI